MSSGRDSQKGKLYNAEGTAFGYTQRNFSSIREVQAYSNSVTSSLWWRRLGGPKFVLVKKTRIDSGYSTAWAHRNEIHITQSHFNKWVVLHELAHIVMWHLAKNRPAHGPDYALVYSRMVEEFLGDEQRQKLSVAFEKYGVRANSDDRRVINALSETL
jgi:putative metallohydrolase (TIGR04338 family)